jgi:hypothetical protein
VTAAESARDLIVGAFDCHTHVEPDLWPRSIGAYEYCRGAAELGMGGLVFKNHAIETASWATLLKPAFPSLELGGSFVTNHCAGGWDPLVTETALRFGARIVYMPTISTEHFIKRLGMANGGGENRPLGAYPVPAETPAGYPLGMSVLTEDRTIREDVHVILELIREYDAALGTGHLAATEILPLIDAARDHGIERIIVTHVTFPVIGDIRRDVWTSLAEKGVAFEHAYQNTKPLPRIKKPVSIEQMVADIMNIGPEHCTFSTNYGAPTLPPPHLGLLEGIEALLTNGMPAEAVRTITRETPRRVFGFA